MNSGTNHRDLTERANTGTNHGDLAERVNSGTNLGDLTERVSSGTNLGDLVEKANSGINLGDLAERGNSGINLGDLAEGANSGINLRDLAERAILGTDLGDLIERANSGTNLRDFAERANSRSNTASRLSTGCTSRNPGNVPIVRTRPGSPRSSSKRSSDASVPSDDPARRHKKVKVLSRRHKSRHDEGGSRSHSKGKEPTTYVEEPEGQAESPDEAGTLVFVCPRSMKDMCGMKVRKDDVGYYALHMSDLAQQDLDKEMRARGLLHPQLARELYTLLSEVLLARAAKEMILMTLFDRVHDACRLITFIDYRINNLLQEIDALKAGGGPEAVVAAEERVAELERTQQEQTEALQRLETSDK
ncbi:hypothetical protein B296_00031456 [Ensete ventricosum]|uniref:Uncharacterized protein n=1 Tax=Ensete ventricosum TaxID=4639 RepID=A0A427AGA4_ENSVE|nr:hypothetical protein B296_00031456 [Ensete ventricosum]